MKEDTLQRPFLAYANLPLKRKPENLHKIFDSIEHYYTVPEEGRAYIRRMVDTLIQLSKHNDPGIIAKYKGAPIRNDADSSEESAEDIEFDERDIQEAMKLLGMPREEAMIRLRGTKPVDPESLPEDQMIFPREVRGVNRGVGFHDDMSSIIDIAAEAVYGYRDGFCESTCKLRDLIIQESGKDIFSSPERPKCYECYQTFFIHMLSALAEGRPYSQIPDLINFLNDTRKNLKTELQIVPAPERTTFKEELEDVVMFQAEDPFFFGAMRGGPPVAYKWIFRNFLYGLVANSLTEFLLGKDNKSRPNRLRLKKCPICGTFFAGRIDKIYCKRQCKSRGIYLSPEKRNKIRRNQKKYYDEFFKSPPKTNLEFTEEEIEEMMRETGESREEAIAILKAETEDNDI